MKIRPNSGENGIVAAVPIFLALAAATLIPLWKAPGWPVNHDNTFGIKTYIYARHFSWFDLLPIWSSADAMGFGSPVPLMYHKLFFLVAAALALVGFSLKAADVCTVALFLVAGALGMYLTMRRIGASRLAATVAGCALISANYTVTDWLVRGAVAEFSGAMMLPWVLLAFIASIQSQRIAPALGLTLGLTWLGHSVLGFYTGLLLFVTTVVLAAFGLVSWSILKPRPAWRALVWLALLVGPYLAALAIIGPRYDFGRLLLPDFRPVDQFADLLGYFWNRYYPWGRTVSGLTIELDHAMLTLLVVGTVALARWPAAAAVRRRDLIRLLTPFLTLLALAFLLQLPVSAPFYEWVPGAMFLQFPWRLNAIMTPLLIIVAIFVADVGLPHDLRLFSLGGAVAWMIAGCGAFAPLQDPRINLDPPQTANLSFSSFREFEPAAARSTGELTPAIAARWETAGCSYARLDQPDQEVPAVRFSTTCGNSALLPLPVFASPLHTVWSSKFVRRRQPCMEIPGFSGACGAVIPAAGAVVTVELPRMAAVASWAWRRLRGRASM